MESYTILLIEDDPGDVTLFREYLEQGSLKDSRVVTARTLEDGIDQLRNGDVLFDVVIVDLLLSGGAESPMAVLKRVVIEVPTLALIVLTGLDKPYLGRKCLRAGADEFIEKDYLSAKVLEREIPRTVERRRHAYLLQRLLARIRIDDDDEDLYKALNGRYVRNDLYEERSDGLKEGIRGNRKLIIAVLLILVAQFIAVVVRTEMLENRSVVSSSRPELVLPEDWKDADQVVGER